MVYQLSRRNFLIGSTAAIAVSGVGLSGTPASAATLSVAEIEQGLWRSGTDGTFTLPPGTYFLDRPLKMPPRRTLDASAATIRPNASMRDLVRISYRCKISGGTWHANKDGKIANSVARSIITNETGSAENGVSPIQPANHSRIENARFLNENGEFSTRIPAAIRLERTIGSQISNCSFDGYYQCVNAVSARNLNVSHNSFRRLLDAVVPAVGATQVDANTGAGSFLLLGGRKGQGGCDGVVVEANHNPNPWVDGAQSSEHCLGTNELGGHIIATTIGHYEYSHNNIRILGNQFYGNPDTAWTQTNGKPNITGGTGDMIAIKNTRYFEIYNNYLSDSGEFGITAVARSGRAGKQSKIHHNTIERSDGSALVVGGADTRKVTNILVDNNEIIDAGINNGDLDPVNSEGVKLQGPRFSPQINYPNARAALRIWSAENVVLNNNTITNYRSSAIWIKSDHWSNENYRLRNDVRNLFGGNNRATAHSSVYHGGSSNRPGTTRDSVIVHTPGGWSGKLRVNGKTLESAL